MTSILSQVPTDRLLTAALRNLESELQRRLHADGFVDVTLAHTKLLRHLDADGMRLQALAEDAGITKQGVSQGVQALQARNLVSVLPDPNDKRAKRVVHTKRGRELIARAMAHVVDLEILWVSTLGSQNYDGLRAGLVKMGDNG